jgi:hypothetical protein
MELADGISRRTRMDKQKALALVIQSRTRGNPAAWLEKVLNDPKWEPADWALDEAGATLRQFWGQVATAIGRDVLKSCRQPKAS